jgi:hypothetical protein
MGSLMDLIAGDERDIVLALAVEDLAGLADPDRFIAHLSLGGGLDPTWLDLFSEAVRGATGLADPVDFLDARSEVEDAAATTERIVERVAPAWVLAVAAVPDEQLGAVAGRWIALLEEEQGVRLPREDKPWIRDLAGKVVEFCRASAAAPVVVFAWGF